MLWDFDRYLNYLWLLWMISSDFDYYRRYPQTLIVIDDILRLWLLLMISSEIYYYRWYPQTLIFIDDILKLWFHRWYPQILIIIDDILGRRCCGSRSWCFLQDRWCGKVCPESAGAGLASAHTGYGVTQKQLCAEGCWGHAD